MKPLFRPAVTINDAFWAPRLARNAQVSIFQQRILKIVKCWDDLSTHIPHPEVAKGGNFR